MTKAIDIVRDKENSEFYPTPRDTVRKMLEGVDWTYITTILEPSAGKGDILRELAIIEKSKHTLDVDCIEVDPNLRQILAYNFGDRKTDINSKILEVGEKYPHFQSQRIVYYDEAQRKYIPLPDSDRMKIMAMKQELDTFFHDGIHIVHDDFFTFQPFKQYDLIVMNPPFSDGDKHLLKALDIQKDGGNIVCLLNAETIRNPYTPTRKQLQRKLQEHNAQIEFISGAFDHAERKADVEIALIKVSIEQKQEESDIYSKMYAAEQAEEVETEVTDLEVSGLIKALTTRFRVEVNSCVKLIREYNALIPYMKDGNDDYAMPILKVTLRGSANDDVSVNKYLKAVRLKYWKLLLSNPKFVGRLTSKQQDEYRRQVDKLSSYDFTEFNILTLSAEMSSQIKEGIEAEIIAMFDRLTNHSYYPECKNNRHYYDGWKTNSAHKIGKKVILPCHNVFSLYSTMPSFYYANKVLNDVEKIFNFLDGSMTREVNAYTQIEESFKRGVTKNIELKYYNVTFYKKGTVHITFTCPELVERFNIYAAQNKKWLPPCYGKTPYSVMTDEEKAVVDSFQGEAAYNEILEKSDYYFAPVTAGDRLLLDA